VGADAGKPSGEAVKTQSSADADAGKPAGEAVKKQSSAGADAGKSADVGKPAPEIVKKPTPPRVSFSQEAATPSESGKHRHEEPSPRDTSSNRAQKKRRSVGDGDKIAAAISSEASHHAKPAGETDLTKAAPSPPADGKLVEAGKGEAPATGGAAGAAPTMASVGTNGSAPAQNASKSKNRNRKRKKKTGAK
jgi:hypothetical protein